ncbi:MAG TPA: O-antigen ligase family protein [Gaiellaceae bacterium]
MTLRTLTSFLFLASVFCCTFEKIHWNFGGAVSLADVLALLFLVSYAVLTRPRLPLTSVILIGFFGAFVLVYMIGFYNLETSDALAQFEKGLVKFVIHFVYLAAAVAWLWRRGRAYYWRSLAWFCGGVAVNAAYGVLQLLVARGGGNLDAQLLSPITGGASQINVYGAVEGGKVYRPNALTGDPNHLGIMLIIPLLILTPIYLRLERRHPLRVWLAVLIAFLFTVEIATLSRSGLLGLGVGAIVLAIPYRGYLRSRALIAPLAAALAVLAVVVLTRLHFFEVVIKSRFNTSGGSQSAHFEVYTFVPQILHSHPLFGLGLNNFSIYYEFVTGKSNWGPHSFYVSLIVETGIVGTALFAAFLVWVFVRLRNARRLGRLLTQLRDPLAARVRPLAWGCTAALVGTLAANAFYLTMQFYYFYAFLAFALAIPLVFATAQSESPTGSRTLSSTRSAGTSRS